MWTKAISVRRILFFLFFINQEVCWASRILLQFHNFVADQAVRCTSTTLLCMKSSVFFYASKKFVVHKSMLHYLWVENVVAFCVHAWLCKAAHCPVHRTFLLLWIKHLVWIKSPERNCESIVLCPTLGTLPGVPPPPCVTFCLVVVPYRGPGQSPVLPFACCVGLLLSAGRCGRCSCWCRFRVPGAQ